MENAGPDELVFSEISHSWTSLIDGDDFPLLSTMDLFQNPWAI
jgi:hypothetical protein